MTPPSRSKSTNEISTVIAEREEDADDHAGEDERVHGHAARPRGDRVHRDPRHQRAAEGERGEAERVERPGPEPEDLRR